MTAPANDSAFLTPIRPTTRTSDVCRKLIAHLMRGDWREGDRMPSERELCQRLGVGRASLREALKALEIMGMVESRVGEGTFVLERSAFFSRPLMFAITGGTYDEVESIIEARQTIEAALAGFAAERATPSDLEEIRKYLDQMREAVTNAGTFLEADLSFHLAVAQAGHNQILLNAVQMLRNLMREWIAETMQVKGTLPQAVEQHERIFDAISQRDKDAARKAMTEHLEVMGTRLIKVKELRESSLGHR
jgi:GntR family transcriptional repressor for pyruvate dehydrogenase complex